MAVHACYGLVGSRPGAGGGPDQDERHGGSQASTAAVHYCCDTAVVAATINMTKYPLLW